MPRDLIQHPDPLPIAHSDTVRAVCLRAADYIERNGWALSPNARWPATCAEGAIAWALGCIPVDNSGADHLRPYFRNPIRGKIEESLGVGLISSWNDAPGRTVTEVLALLRGTAGR